MKMEAIDPERLKRSEKFVAQFAEFKTIKTSDEKEIRFALFRPAAFEAWIVAHGGKREGDLIVPVTPADWEQLQQLREFRWFKEEGQSFRVPEKRDDLADKCVLRIQGFGRTIPMDKAFIGAHLALGVSYAIFDWREGDLTSTGFFQDAETAYQTLREEHYEPEQIIPMGSCRATFVIGKLKEDHHAEGMNGVMIQPPPSLEQAIKGQNCVASYLGMSAISAVETERGDYDTIARLRRLKPHDRAKLCVILSEHDTTLPPDTEKQFVDASIHSGTVDIVLQKTEEGVDAHLQEPLRDPDVFNSYAEFLQNA